MSERLLTTPNGTGTTDYQQYCSCRGRCTVPSPRLHPRRGLDLRLRREVPAPARVAEIGTPRAGEAARPATASDGSHRDKGDPTAGVWHLRTFRHVESSSTCRTRRAHILPGARFAPDRRSATKEPEGSACRKRSGTSARAAMSLLGRCRFARGNVPAGTSLWTIGQQVPLRRAPHAMGQTVRVLCSACGEAITSDDSGVSIDSSGSARLVPFIGDLRSDPHRLVHVRCFIDERGLDAFVSLVADHSMKQQAEFIQLLDQTSVPLPTSRVSAETSTPSQGAVSERSLSG
jgi:hypothetical protein